MCWIYHWLFTGSDDIPCRMLFYWTIVDNNMLLICYICLICSYCFDLAEYVLLSTLHLHNASQKIQAIIRNLISKVDKNQNFNKVSNQHVFSVKLLNLAT